MDATQEIRIDTVDGSTKLESYVAGVVAAENGAAAQAALRAQAVAARTFVLRAMRDDPNLGTYKKPIPNSERFQVYVHSPSPRAVLAAAETAGIVCRYKGELIICNYVAGAIWTTAGKPGQDPTATEKWVTYNDGKTGAAVKPTSLSNTGRTDNRGCKSQNGADWLARNGQDYRTILRYFYGADLEIGPLFPSLPAEPIPQQPQGPQGAPAGAPRGDSLPLPALALAALALLEQGGR